MDEKEVNFSLSYEQLAATTTEVIEAIKSARIRRRQRKFPVWKLSYFCGLSLLKQGHPTSARYRLTSVVFRNV